MHHHMRCRRKKCLLVLKQKALNGNHGDMCIPFGLLHGCRRIAVCLIDTRRSSPNISQVECATISSRRTQQHSGGRLGHLL